MVVGCRNTEGKDGHTAVQPDEVGDAVDDEGEGEGGEHRVAKLSQQVLEDDDPCVTHDDTDRYRPEH